MKKASALITLAVCVALSSALSAQEPSHLTLKEAETQAAQNHPRILGAEYLAKAAGEAVNEVRSIYQPSISASVTGAEALDNTRITAGALNNPTILDRFAYGVAGTELLSDFGRTGALSASATYRANAVQQDVVDQRAAVLLRVDQAYFDALRGQSVLRVASDTVTARQLVVDQATELANAGLKSSLDVSFATVNLSEARLLLLQAQNDAQAAFAVLAAAIGAPQAAATYQLDEPPAPGEPPADSAALIAEALRDRPDIARERLAQQSQAKFADAESDLWRPTLSMAAAAGVTPFHQDGVADHYAAAGVNVTLPVFTGGLFGARRAEAGFKASAQEQVVRDLEDRVARDVRLAWLDAQTSFQRLDLTNQLLSEATEALDLAQQRYTLGLSSIVELTQAQLTLTRAQIDQAAARYDYQEKNAALRFQIGAMK
jgi:outer membrane protein